MIDINIIQLCSLLGLTKIFFNIEYYDKFNSLNYALINTVFSQIILLVFLLFNIYNNYIDNLFINKKSKINYYKCFKYLGYNCYTLILIILYIPKFTFMFILPTWFSFITNPNEFGKNGDKTFSNQIKI